MLHLLHRPRSTLQRPGPESQEVEELRSDLSVLTFLISLRSLIPHTPERRGPLHSVPIQHTHRHPHVHVSTLTRYTDHPHGRTREYRHEIVHTPLIVADSIEPPAPDWIENGCSRGAVGPMKRLTSHATLPRWVTRVAPTL